MRSARMAVAFSILGLLLGGVAASSEVVQAILFGWAALSLAMVGVAYAGAASFIFRKNPRSGQLPWHRKLILLPYLGSTSLLWHAARVFSRAPPFGELAPGLIIGRRLRCAEYPPGVRTIVDLTHELEERWPGGESASYLSLPILDGAPLRPDELKRVALQIASVERPVYLHCALGHGRTAMVAGAVLITLRLSSSPDDALTRIAAVRPGARPNREQRNALEACARFTHPGGRE
ncbi:MAG: hypothetical protein HOV80_28545 [Polyangiaceae bacterium]|nr:hypothetical protein [Polyangiaceae bacterium]